MEPLLPAGTTRSNRFYLSPGWWALLSFFVMVLVMGFLKIYSPDLGFHLKSAQWITEHRHFIYTDTFNYGSAENKYYDLQWLFQLIVYGLYNMGGAKLLVVSNALLITASMILVWYRFTKNTNINYSGAGMVLFVLMAILFVQPLTFEIRPHVFSWLYLNLVLLSLESFKRGSKKALFALPVIMLLWANTHSLAILGIVTIGIYNAGLYLEKNKFDKNLLIFSGLSFVALLFTPYFFNGIGYAFSQFGLISGNSLLKSYFGELQSPFTAKEINLLGIKYFTNPLLLIHLAAIVSIFSIIRSLFKKQFTNTLLLIAYFFLLYLANKNYGYFLMVSLPLMAQYSWNWLEDRRQKKLLQKLPASTKKKDKGKAEPLLIPMPAPRRKLYNRLSFSAIIIAIVISVTTVTDSLRLFIHSPYRFGFTMDDDQLPVEATDFLNNNHLKGRLLNHLDFGGYLMANFEEKVFIDGRMDVLPEDFFSEYYASLTEKNGFKRLLGDYNPDIIIFPYVKAYNWWTYFVSKGKRAGYKAVYFDGLSVIYVKSDKYPGLPEVTQHTILANLDTTAASRINKCLETTKPSGLIVLMKGLWQQQQFSLADQNRSIYCFTNGFDTAALNYSVIAVEHSTVATPNIFKNLSLYYQDKKMYAEAQLCEEKSD